MEGLPSNNKFNNNYKIISLSGGKYGRENKRTNWFQKI